MINQLLGDNSSNYMFLGFFIILIIILLFWWIQRNERRKMVELEHRVSMLTQVVQDTAQNVNVIIERSERTQSADVQPTQQTTQGTQVNDADIENEPSEEVVERTISGGESGKGSEYRQYAVEELEELEELEEQDDSSDDGNYSELDSLTDEESVKDNVDGTHDVERIEVSDIEDIQSVSQEDANAERDSAVEVKTINLEQPQLEQNEVSHLQTNIEHCVVDEELQKQYNKMTVKELRKIGEEKEIGQVDKMKKKTIVDILSRVPVESVSETNAETTETATNENE